MSKIISAILETLPSCWHITHLYIGPIWTAVTVTNPSTETAPRMGLAATPSAEQIAGQSRFQLGVNSVNPSEALPLAQLALSNNHLEAAVGLATINALLQPEKDSLKDIDAGDWLVENGRGRKLAVVGRFPFIDELQPIVSQLWVLELNPQVGEYAPDQAHLIIPQADILAVTSSTLVNHTLDDLLRLAKPTTHVIMIGPTTPLSPVLFNFGVDLLSGVQVVDPDFVLKSVKADVSFRKMGKGAGLRRVSLVANGPDQPNSQSGKEQNDKQSSKGT